MFHSKRTIKMVAILVMALVLASITYAFAAANTMPTVPIGAGEGETSVTGYEITNVQFTLDTTDPSMLASVSFGIDPVPGTAKVELVDGSGTWYDCTEGATTTCTLTGATVRGADQFRVVAVE